MTVPSAKIIADSISPEGVRLTTVQAVIHRFILAEVDTHRVFSRNSASSRAIPVVKQLAKFCDDTALPVSWPAEQKGMSGGAELEGKALADAKALFERMRGGTVGEIQRYLDDHPDPETRLHKSLLNRLMEWGQWHTVVITSTAWDNFYGLRLSPAAQPEFRVVAAEIAKAREASTPTPINNGFWHLPYIEDVDVRAAEKYLHETRGVVSRGQVTLLLIKMSAARVARTSYETMDGKRDPGEDVALYEKLTSAHPMHSSPLEHVATPNADNLHSVAVMSALPHIETGGFSGMRLTLPLYGNFLGWHQHRFDVEAQRGYQAFS